LEDRPKWQIFLIKLASKLTCLFYDKIICVSQNDCNEALKNKIAPARKLIVINNGINPADYDFSSTSTSTPDFDVMESSSKSGVDVNEFWVGTIGENVKNKGHKYLREAAKKMAGVELNIISGVPNAAKFLKSFDIFVLPSVKEGLPYVILEAGLAKLPVIASNVGGVSEIITDGENGLLVPPKNPEALAEAIKKLINDKATREKLAQNLHQKILQDFSLQKMLSATVATYEK